MKVTKKNIKAVLVAGLLAAPMVMLSTVSQAAYCSPADIVAIQMEDTAPSADASQYKVRIYCPRRDVQNVYYLSDTISDAGYATLLTALSLNKQIHIDMTDYTDGNIITKIQLVK